MDSFGPHKQIHGRRGGGTCTSSMQANVSNHFQLKQSKGDRHVTYVAW
jgi:hypothetical protein